MEESRPEKSGQVRAETFSSRTPSQAGRRQPCGGGGGEATAQRVAPGHSVSAAPARPPQPGPRAPDAGVKLAAAVMSPRGAEEAEGPPGSPARLV